MNALFEYLYRATREHGFRVFQDELTQATYEALGKCAAKQSNELQYLDGFIGALNAKSYDRLQIHARRIHGKRSYVQFRYHDQPTTKELADTALITCVTRKGSIVYERLSLIQHKVIRENKTSIDPAQLFLLKNFPQFTSDCGLFKTRTPTKVSDLERSLGSFGFFADDGEFLFTSAERLSHAIGATTSHTTREHIGRSFTRGHRDNTSGGFPFFGGHSGWMAHPKYLERYLMVLHDLHGHLPFGDFLHSGAYGVSASTGCSDLHEFAHDLILLRIGALVSFDGDTSDASARTISRKCLRAMQLEGVEVPLEQKDDTPIEGEMAIIVAHVSL